jgi:hypothetical protein
MSTYSYNNNTTPHRQRNGRYWTEIGRKQNACEDAVHTDTIVEALTDKKEQLRQ